MSLFDLLSWDAFGSGWFWSLIIVQWVWHSAQVLGVPVDCLQSKDGGQLSTIVKWRAQRRLLAARQAPLAIVAAISFLVSVLLILGFVYHIELCAAASLLIVPELVIFRLGYRTAETISAKRQGPEPSIKDLKKLHLKIYATGAMAIFFAGIFGYGFEVLTQ
ncbi:MAG: hypothetical protein P8P24_06360 [Planktomarina sp.]|nr:hypothetical protein [Planktomarina sp.]MDG1294892.1 hypothetical protein [Planktomarina sp.]